MIERDGTAVYTNFQDIGEVTAEIAKYEQYVRDGRKVKWLSRTLIAFYAIVIGFLVYLTVWEVDRREAVYVIVLGLVMAAANVWCVIPIIRQGADIKKIRAADKAMLRLLRSIAEILTEENDREQESKDGN